MRLVSILSFLCLFYSSAYSQLFNEQVYKFSKVLDWLDNYYVDSVNQEEIVEKAIRNLLHDLDPHSAYLTKEDVERLHAPLQGNFEGIGISFNILFDTIYVISPISGGPSERVGIRAGDRIVKVEEENVAGIGITNQDVISKLRGKKGTKVTVSVKRQGVAKLLDFTITRDKIPLYSLDAKYIIDEKTGYIKISRFASTTLDEFLNAFDELNSHGIENLILDLRDNGGGYLDMAVKLADEFLDSSRLIVYTQGLHNDKKDYKCKEKGAFEKGKLIILIDEGSASASEILAGAIQDWDRGIIVGRRSFGKGLVQSPLDLPDGSMVRLTVARYYTPTGRLIQKPYEDGYSEYERDIVNRYEHGEMVNKDSISFSDSLKYKTLTLKRTVYGGGGIMPDVFVSLDTSSANDYYSELIRKGILYRFVLKYIDVNRQKLTKLYPNFNLFNNNFKVSEKIINDLIEFAESEGVEKSEIDSLALSDIKLLVKAYIARDLWDTSEYFQVVNAKNEILQQAIDLLRNEQLFNKYLSPVQK